MFSLGANIIGRDDQSDIQIKLQVSNRFSYLYDTKTKYLIQMWYTNINVQKYLIFC